MLQQVHGPETGRGPDTITAPVQMTGTIAELLVDSAVRSEAKRKDQGLLVARPREMTDIALPRTISGGGKYIGQQRQEPFLRRFMKLATTRSLTCSARSDPHGLKSVPARLASGWAKFLVDGGAEMMVASTMPPFFSRPLGQAVPDLPNGRCASPRHSSRW